jgi:outer membrane protein assembly factor BamB
MSKYIVDENRILVNGHEVIFDFNICESLYYADLLIVIIRGQSKAEDRMNNVYCVNANGKIIWRIQDMQEVYPDFTIPASYVGINEYPDGSIVCLDYMGGRFVIDPKSGRIIDNLEAVK